MCDHEIGLVNRVTLDFGQSKFKGIAVEMHKEHICRLGKIETLPSVANNGVRAERPPDQLDVETRELNLKYMLEIARRDAEAADVIPWPDKGHALATLRTILDLAPATIVCS